MTYAIWTKVPPPSNGARHLDISAEAQGSMPAGGGRHGALGHAPGKGAQRRRVCARQKSKVGARARMVQREEKRRVCVCLQRRGKRCVCHPIAERAKKGQGHIEQRIAQCLPGRVCLCATRSHVCAEQRQDESELSAVSCNVVLPECDCLLQKSQTSSLCCKALNALKLCSPIPNHRRPSNKGPDQAGCGPVSRRVVERPHNLKPQNAQVLHGLAERASWVSRACQGQASAPYFRQDERHECKTHSRGHTAIWHCPVFSVKLRINAWHLQGGETATPGSRQSARMAAAVLYMAEAVQRVPLRRGPI
eukprot:1157530-Pelagomonas_calceolata.AAC.1